MSWEDIDFELITKGMITKGPAEVSFADYLNTFSWALDERLNMLIVTPVGSYPDLPNIFFEVGEIRTQKNGFDNPFWMKFKSLVSEYYNLWKGRDWYTVELMTDPVNHADYLLEDSDLIEIITQETFDILADINNKIPLEYFTADVINAMYEIYKLTKYMMAGLRATIPIAGVEDELFLWGSSTLSSSEGLNNMNSVDNRPDNSPYFSFGAADFDARIGYKYDRNNQVTALGSIVITEQSTSSVREEKLIPDGEGGFDERDVWDTGYLQAWDLVNVYSRYRDLEDNILEMEVNTYCLVFRNFTSHRTDKSDPLTIDGPYDSNFAQKNTGGDLVPANSDSLRGEAQQTPFGTKRVWSGNNSGPMPSPILFGAGASGEYYSEFQQFEVLLSEDMATNINHPDLEFFIED